MTGKCPFMGRREMLLGLGKASGAAVVGGLVVSQLITLYLTPVVYTYMAGLFKTRTIRSAVAKPATA